MELLDERLLREVFLRMKAEDVITCARVCKKFYSASDKSKVRREFLIAKILRRPFEGFPYFLDSASSMISEDHIKEFIRLKIPFRIAKLLDVELDETIIRGGLSFLGNLCLLIAKIGEEGNADARNQLSLQMLIDQFVLDAAAEMIYCKEVATIDLALWCFANISCSLHGIKLIFKNPSFYKFTKLLKKVPPAASSTQRLLAWTIANMLRDDEFQEVIIQQELIDDIIRMHTTGDETRLQVFRSLSRFVFSNYQHGEILYKKDILNIIESLEWTKYEGKMRDEAIHNIQVMERGFFPIFRNEQVVMEPETLERASILALELSYNNPNWTLEFIQSPKIFSFFICGLQYCKYLRSKEWKGTVWNLLKLVEVSCRDRTACENLKPATVTNLLEEILQFKGSIPFELTANSIVYLLENSLWKEVVSHCIQIQEIQQNERKVKEKFKDVSIFFSPAQLVYAEELIENLYLNRADICKKRENATIVKIIEQCLSLGCPFEEKQSIEKFVELSLCFGAEFPQMFPWALEILSNPKKLSEAQLITTLVEESKKYVSEQDARENGASSPKRRKTNSDVVN